MRRFSWGQVALLFGVVIAIPALTVAASHPGAPFPTNSIGSVVVAILLLASIFAVGLSFYWLRENARVSYGIWEIAFGLLLAGKEAVAVVFHLAGVVFAMVIFDQDTFPEEFITSMTLSALQFAAGIYVIVRGLDNIGQGLQKTKYAKRWRWFSLKNDPVVISGEGQEV